MAYSPGITTFRVFEPIVIQNLSEPGFEILTLGVSSNGGPFVSIIPPGQFREGYTMSFSNPGIKELQISGTRNIPSPPGGQYIQTFSRLLNIGYPPRDRIEFNIIEDQSLRYMENYVKRGISFSFLRRQGSPPGTEPKNYLWTFSGGISYSGITETNQFLLYNTVGNKFVTLITSNPWGTTFSRLDLRCVDTPKMKISTSVTFGNISIGTVANFAASVIDYNTHLHTQRDIEYDWIVGGENYPSDNRLTYAFGRTGTVGVTLLYRSKIFENMNGYTYGEYNVTGKQFPFYISPGELLAFTPDDPEYSYYVNQMLQYASAYRTIYPHETDEYASNTFDACMVQYENFTPEEQAGNILVNCEEPWLVLLGSPDTMVLGPTHPWKTNQSVIEEGRRVGIKVDENTTLATLKEIGIRCWTDVVRELKTRGAGKVIHYATSIASFSDYRGVPNGMIEYGPIPGITQKHYWYQADSVYFPILRETFDNAVETGRFVGLMKAQANADAHGAASYCFMPNSPAGLCGISYWGGDDIVLKGYSGGTVFTNPTDFTPEVLEEAVKVTSNKMWIEYYRGCQQTARYGYIDDADIPASVAPVLNFGINAFPPEVFTSKYKFTGLLKKDPLKTAEREVKAIFENNYRVNYSEYDSPDIKPEEIWFWDNTLYYHINTPKFHVPATGPYDYRQLEAATMRNSHEIAFFNRPELSPGNSLWYSGNIQQNINYYINNSLPNDFWTQGFKLWWGMTGGTLGNLLPAPCSLTPNSPLAQWLDFTQPITRDKVIKAMKYKFSDHALQYVIKVREKLNELF